MILLVTSKVRDAKRGGAPAGIAQRERSNEHCAFEHYATNADGTGFEYVARGVRNTVGADFHPVTNELYFTNHGRDWLGDDVPHDTLPSPDGAGVCCAIEWPSCNCTRIGGFAPDESRCIAFVCDAFQTEFHATTDEQRTALVPPNRKYPLAAILDACRAAGFRRAAWVRTWSPREGLFGLWSLVATR